MPISHRRAMTPVTGAQVLAPHAHWPQPPSVLGYDGCVAIASLDSVGKTTEQWYYTCRVPWQGDLKDAEQRVVAP